MEQCRQYDISYIIFKDLFSHEDYDSNPNIRKFKNMHKGERCFLIGNGSSLSANDLTKLYNNNEVSFGCNAIYKVYSQTKWRPDYYVLMDLIHLLEEGTIDVIPTASTRYKFIKKLPENNIYKKYYTKLLEKDKNNFIYFNTVSESVANKLPRFSDDVSRAFYACGTTMYTLIQLAVYMGFITVYLLGVDGTMSSMKEPEKFLSEKRHFYDENTDFVNLASLSPSRITEETSDIRTINAYKKSEEYTRGRGIRIYNATRGGQVEIFERVSFDSLF
jgi:hypothetical protein